MTTIEAPPAEGIWRDERHRYYVDGRGPLPGVTTVVKVVDRSGPLVGWAKRETAACAVRNLDMLARLVETGGPDAAAGWLSRIPDYKRDTSAEMGRSIHSMADQLARGNAVSPTPDEVPFINAYQRFVLDRAPRIFLSECMVANLTVGYGGTFDIGAEIDGELGLLDLKTGGSVYPEHALQLAGYSDAEFGGWPGSSERITLPRWDFHAVLHLVPNQPVPYRLVRMPVDDLAREAFRAAVRLVEWQQRERGAWA